ncbi:unnamed protein product, partial [Mesorhabditis belari]|uniref:EGF-like domain-containing protein n=1 Tax=Mesorhabditis belari TaxID=2138241 RepID=A0AAF3EA34_9BILA
MESGAPFPRLAAGIYHRKPQPILSRDEERTLETASLSVKSTVKSPMRQPPPKWLPPQPPTNQQALLSPDEETYEDPETINDMKAHSSRDKLMLHGNSYEVSTSQMRQSQLHEAPPLDDWSPAECILHKNSEGAYYIPTSFVCAPSPTTNVSTLPPHQRYDKGCTSTRHSCVEPQVNTALLKRQSTLNSKKMKNLKEDSPSRRATPLVFCLLLALLAALLVIIVLLLRAPRYVYSSSYAGSTSMSADRLSELRPLPDTIQLGQRVFADLIPQSIAYTEIYIPRPTRVTLNVTVGTGAQLVLFGRHSVAPSLSLHDFFHPIRAELIATHASHSIEESSRKRREAIEIVTPRIASVEHFILEGRWHLAILNERNRVEPIELIVEALPTHQEITTDGSNKKKSVFRCPSDCSSRGECVNGVCKCASGYTGTACDEVVCPLVCSGNGILSLGRCVCFEGRECDVQQHWCEIADCNGRGRCTPRGVCDCIAGWSGDSCEIRSCPHPSCSGRGKCLDGVCYCEDGWTGSECSKNVRTLVFPKSNIIAEKSHEELKVIVEASPLSPATSSHHSSHPHRSKANSPLSIDPTQHPNSLKAVIESRETEPTENLEAILENPCNNRGRVDSQGFCICSLGFTGPSCELVSCTPECLQGVCHHGVCTCKNGWKGIDCSQKECALGCEQHGRCEKNGTCLCDRGWNGENCYQEGCPRDCSGRGQCRLGVDGWWCECDTGRRGADCSLFIEHSCDDGVDNDHNGLMDCEDPKCCASESCRLEPSCMMAPSPIDVLLKLPTPQNAPFYQRVMFLIKNDSVQSYADYSQFDESIASVVRGRVLWDGGASGTVADLPLPGVRVSDVNHPLYGFTLSRLDGSGAFDLLVNGGRTIQLQFLRSPFQRRKLSVYVPPNEIVYVGDVVMHKEKKTEDELATRVRQECSISKRSMESVEIRNDWKIWGAPSVNGNAKVLADVGAVSDSIQIPGTQVYLVYDSRRSDGSLSRLEMRLTGSKPDSKLRLVHLRIDVAGTRFTKKLAARADLSYTFAWNKQNVYKQMESGLVPVVVHIGYEYEHCSRESEILWVTKRSYLSGKARKTSFGGWTPHIHHHYDVVNNVLEKGDGSRLFLSAENPVVDLLVGSDGRRELDCQSCHSAKANSPLLRPVTVAAGIDGSVLIGDQNLIRRLTPRWSTNHNAYPKYC